LTNSNELPITDRLPSATGKFYPAFRNISTTGIHGNRLDQRRISRLLWSQQTIY